LVELARDTLREAGDVASALALLQVPAQALEHAVRALRAAMDVLPVRGTGERALEAPGVAEAFEALSAALAGLATALQPLRESSPGLDACHARAVDAADRKSTRLNSSHVKISYAVFCLKKKNKLYYKPKLK